MKFTIIDPKSRAIRTVNHDDLNAALIDAGLNPDDIDHGTMGRIDDVGVAYVASAYGLCEPVATQSYFSIARSLFAGPIVVYGFVPGLGETVDAPELPAKPAIVWIDDPFEAATMGLIDLKTRSPFKA